MTAVRAVAGGRPSGLRAIAAESRLLELAAAAVRSESAIVLITTDDRQVVQGTAQEATIPHPNEMSLILDGDFRTLAATFAATHRKS